MGFLAIPYPAINPVALQLGPLSVKWYGLAYVAGLLLGRLYVKALLQQGRLWPSEKRPFAPEMVDDLLLFMTVGVLLGGRLGYVLFYQPRFFAAHPLEIAAVWNGGMSFHGALLGSIVAIYLFARRSGAELWSVMDLAAAATPMGLFFGRLANFINGELWGRPSTVPWAMVFPDAGDVARHPSQLYEAGTEGLILFAVLWWLTHRMLAFRTPGRGRRHLHGRLRPGAIVLRIVPRAGRRPLVHVRSLHRRHPLFAADDPGRRPPHPHGQTARCGAGTGRCRALTTAARRARCWRSCARASSGRARCRSTPTCAPA